DVFITEGWLAGISEQHSGAQTEEGEHPAQSARPGFSSRDETVDYIEDFSAAFVDCEIGDFDTGEFIIAEAKRQQFFARLTAWREDGARIAIYFQTEGEIERFREIMAEAKISLGEIDLLEGTLARGFCFPAANLVMLAAAELFGRPPTHGRRRLQRVAKFGTHRAQIDFSELNE